MSFVKGFAEGFINERNRRLETKKEEDQLSMRYRLEQLSKDQERRQTQRDKDKEIIDQAKALANSFNDPSFAPKAAELLKSGRDAKYIIGEWDRGAYKKKTNTTQTLEIPNPARKNTMSMPAGVLSSDVQVEQPPTDLSGRTHVPKTTEEPLSEIDAKIKTFAPSLFEKPPEEDAKLFDGSDWEYTPEKITEKLPDIKDLYYQRQVALKEFESQKAKGLNPNKSNIEDLDMKIRASTAALTLSKDVQPNQRKYAVIGADGAVSSFLTAERGIDDNGQEVLFNVTNGEKKLVSTKNLVEMDEDTLKLFTETSFKFSEKTTKYNTQRASFVSALSTVDKIDQVLTRNPNAATMQASFIGALKGLQNELGSAYDLYAELGATANGVEKALSSDNPEDAKKYADSFREQIDGLLSRSGKSLAEDQLLFSALKTSLTYQIAASNGQEGNALAAKEVAMFEKMLGGSTPPSIRANMQNVLSLSYNNLESNRISLNQEVAAPIKTLRMMMGNPEIKTGFEVERVGDHLARMDPETGQRLKVWFEKSRGQTIPDNTYGAGPGSTEVTNPTQETESQFTVGKTYKFKQGTARYLGGPVGEGTSWEQIK